MRGKARDKGNSVKVIRIDKQTRYACLSNKKIHDEKMEKALVKFRTRSYLLQERK